jgi:hypothetical protein
MPAAASPVDAAGEAGTRAPVQAVLIDCYANPHLFVSDAVFRALADELAADGVTAACLDLVRDEAPPGAAIDDVLAAVRAAGPAVVIISRAWSAALIDTLREAAAGARMVRYSHGAPGAIDRQFDAVLDAAGIRAFLAGNEEIRAPNWRRTRREMAVPRPQGTPNSAGRPTISGPAGGCPFLVDVRTSPAFRDSGIDFERVQTKGCAFCLDNVGAYAAFPEPVVVDSWVGQLRALRRARPDVREVLLTDERPHPHLPALFAAILADPALHGIELLVKSRVDWLTEHADGALRAACELAEQSGSLLHLYLIGFESFHQPDLDLFNKAVTVADNMRAIDTLRALAVRHPRSFEFRRHHAHGIVLFHPWTTPASLLDNACVMREVRFHELRRYALRTRLRLYASVPLHALAERQGLLVDHFDDGRIDRAIEQGYDASVPWRFADPRIEAIFRAANRIADALPTLLDADVLEMATRFVLRWPSFADAPDLTALPIIRALYCWGASPADVIAIAGAALAGFDPEVEAVASGAKPACLKEAVPSADVDALVRAYEKMGLAARAVSTHDRGGPDGRHQPGDTHAIVAVAGDLRTLELAVEHQRGVERGEAGRIAAMGELMGYPPCCIEAFAAQRARGDNLDLERAPFRTHPDRPLAQLVNRFGAVALVSHMLCAPDCAASVERAEARLGAVARVDATAPERIVRHLAMPVLRLDYRQAALLAGRWEGEEYLVRTMQPLLSADLGVEPAAVRAIRLAGDHVRFELHGGSEHVMAASAPVIVEPGVAIAAPVRRAIAEAPRVRGADPARAAPGVAGHISALLTPRTRVDDHVIEHTEPDDRGGYRVTLSRGARSLRLLVRPWDPSRPALSRRGAWAFDMEGGGEPTDLDRKVIGALAQLFPAGDRKTRDSR